MTPDVPEDDERFPLVDADGRVVGHAARRACHGRPERLHPVVHCRIVDGRGAVLLQRRAMTKDVQPGKWDTSVGGHVRMGESVAAALAREAREEVGLAVRAGTEAGGAPGPWWELRYPGAADAGADEETPSPPPRFGASMEPEAEPGTIPARFRLRYVHRNAYESELVHVFEAVSEGPFVAQAGEVDALRFWTEAEIAAAGPVAFTPNFLDESERLRMVEGRGGTGESRGF